MMTRRNILKTAAALPLLGMAGAMAQQTWQATRPIRLLVPGQAGGMSDILARQVSNAIGNHLGQPIIVENRPGASGTLASVVLSNSPPDGRFLLTASSDTHTIYPHFYSNDKFQPQKHVPVANIAYVPFMLAVRKDLGVTTLDQFIALAKSRQLSYSSWGVGTTGQAAMMLVMRAAGITDMLHVPFTGSAPAIQALLAGQVDAVTGAIPLIAANRDNLVPIAALSRTRSQAMPDIPTLAQAGLVIDDFKEFWVGVMAPPDTPADIVQAVSEQIRLALNTPEVASRITNLGAIPEYAGPDDFRRIIAQEYAQWGKITQEAGVVAQPV